MVELEVHTRLLACPVVLSTIEIVRYGSQDGCSCQTRSLLSSALLLIRWPTLQLRWRSHVPVACWESPGDQKRDIHLKLHAGMRLQCNYKALSLTMLCHTCHVCHASYAHITITKPPSMITPPTCDHASYVWLRLLRVTPPTYDHASYVCHASYIWSRLLHMITPPTYDHASYVWSCLLRMITPPTYVMPPTYVTPPMPTSRLLSLILLCCTQQQHIAYAKWAH